MTTVYSNPMHTLLSIIWAVSSVGTFVCLLLLLVRGDFNRKEEQDETRDM